MTRHLLLVSSPVCAEDVIAVPVCLRARWRESRRQSEAQHRDTSPQQSPNTNIPAATSQPYWQSWGKKQDHLCSSSRPVSDALDRPVPLSGTDLGCDSCEILKADIAPKLKCLLIASNENMHDIELLINSPWSWPKIGSFQRLLH